MSMMFSWEIREDMAPLRKVASLSVVYSRRSDSSATGDDTRLVMAMIGVPFSRNAFMHSMTSTVSPE